MISSKGPSFLAENYKKNISDKKIKDLIRKMIHFVL